MRAHQIMTRDVITISPHASIMDAANIMLRCHLSGLPVMGEDGMLKGIVSDGRLPSPRRDRHRAPAPGLAAVLRRARPRGDRFRA